MKSMASIDKYEREEYGKLCLCENSPRFHQIASNKRSKYEGLFMQINDQVSHCMLL